MRRNKALPLHQNLPLTYLQALRASFPQDLLRRSSRRALTGVAISEYCARHGIDHKAYNITPSRSAFNETKKVPTIALHCIIPPFSVSDGPTILYFHGGGYINPLQAAGHIPFALQCASACKAQQVIFLEYSLAPEYPYPTQLIQAVTALHFLLHGLYLLPEDIIIIGDSAGGQLVGSLLAHLAKPSPYADPLDLNNQQLRAAVFVSPYITLHATEPSYEHNQNKDYLTREAVLEIKNKWKPHLEDVWANLSGAGNDVHEVWGKTFGSAGQGIVKKAIVTVGTAEVFLDGCRKFAIDIGAETMTADRQTQWETLQLGDLLLVECEGEAHVQPALDVAVRYRRGVMALAIHAWLSQTA